MQRSSYPGLGPHSLLDIDNVCLFACFKELSSVSADITYMRVGPSTAVCLGGAVSREE